MTVNRSSDTPPRAVASWDEMWKGEDEGLIQCWETGRTIRRRRTERDLEICDRVDRGELPSLHWKGGFEIDPDDPNQMPKMKKKFGCLQYLATLQGIKGESLVIDSSQEVAIRCSRTGVLVVFTADRTRWTAS